MEDTNLKQLALRAYQENDNSKLRAVKVILDKTKMPLAFCKELAEKWIDELEGKEYISVQEKVKLLREALEQINSLVANSGENTGNDLLYEIKYIALTTLNQTKNS